MNADLKSIRNLQNISVYLRFQRIKIEIGESPAREIAALCGLGLTPEFHAQKSKTRREN